MSSVATGSADFLTELNIKDSLAVLQSARSAKSTLVFKVDIYPKPCKTFIDNFTDKRAILSVELKDLSLPEDKEVSIKFNVGSEVYFVKTFIRTHLNRYFFDMSSKVFHLKRRKEPRYNIPKKWPQTTCIVLNAMKKSELKSSVVDLSLSGIRLEFKKNQMTPAFRRDDIILIKFQIYKRAEIECTAIVRFILNKDNSPVIVGLEFANISVVQKKRVSSIIEDIKLFSALNKI